MHRFGRSAQQRMKDRWGGGFILATILALLAAWFAGDGLAKLINGRGSTGLDGGLTADTQKLSEGVMAEPQAFELYFVQAGAFRSESLAKEFSHKLSEQQFAAMVGPRNERGLFPVYAGVYTSAHAADDVKQKLVTGGIEGPFRATIAVDYNPGAVPVSTTSGQAVDMKKGLGTLNSYLHEASVWMEGRAGNTQADASRIAALGKSLGEMATSVNVDSQDAKLKQFAEMASAAAKNAAAIEAAAMAPVGSDAYQKAATEYLGLLDAYRTFQASR